MGPLGQRAWQALAVRLFEAPSRTPQLVNAQGCNHFVRWGRQRCEVSTDGVPEPLLVTSHQEARTSTPARLAHEHIAQRPGRRWRRRGDGCISCLCWDGSDVWGEHNAPPPSSCFSQVRTYCIACGNDALGARPGDLWSSCTRGVRHPADADGHTHTSKIRKFVSSTFMCFSTGKKW